MKLPDYVAAPASVNFHRGIFEEHLEEASFLYEQRGALLNDPEVSWANLAGFEERLEAHLDALVAGGGLALEVCRARVADGDFGELFGAVCVFCRQRQANLLSETLEGLDYEDKQKATAVADALKYDLPAEWSVFIDQALARRDARLTPLLAAVSGYRRLPTGAALLQGLAATPVPAIQIINAFGRLNVGEAQEVLESCLRHPAAPVKSAALLALLRTGANGPLQQYQSGSQKESWTRIALGLGGARSVTDVLQEIARSGNADADCLLGLGLLGDPAALQLLYDSLKSPDLVDSAAMALNWITGAELFEEVFVPEEVNEDELSEKELKAWRDRKEAPQRADGKRFGKTVKKLSPNKGTWKRWFADNAAKFDPNLRYRSGKLYAPSSLLANLADERSDHPLRRFAAEELVIRYGCDVPFEVDMPVKRQLQAIREISAWVDANGRRFQPGHWYFAGHPQ
jgi:uncharacterized protein (TIGR02270 family)